MDRDAPKGDSSYKRLRDEPPKVHDDTRLPAERDCDRILYSSAFRRLAGVTQVVAAHEGHVFHNRLTHSLRVAQLARRLAQKIIRANAKVAQSLAIDANVAEAAGLAHDLGHPPFGHIAEATLNALLTEEHQSPDGYEGNAQSFRIVTKLALREISSENEPPLLGLNLTAATLDGILKYPWLRDSEHDYKGSKWGAYTTERDEMQFARKGRNVNDERRSPEAEIMDWADDVTYAVHDVEDFYRAGLIPLDRLASSKDNSERLRFFRAIDEKAALKRKLKGGLTQLHMKDFSDAVENFLLDERYRGTTSQRARLRFFISVLIGKFVDAFNLQDQNGGVVAEIRPAEKRQVDMLKLLTWHYVIYNPTLASQQEGQRLIVRTLFEKFYDAGTNPTAKNSAVIPLSARAEIEAAGRDGTLVGRLVADLISSLTERQATTLFHRLTGIEMGSVMDDLGR